MTDPMHALGDRTFDDDRRRRARSRVVARAARATRTSPSPTSSCACCQRHRRQRAAHARLRHRQRRPARHRDECADARAATASDRGERQRAHDERIRQVADRDRRLRRPRRSRRSPPRSSDSCAVSRRSMCPRSASAMSSDLRQQKRCRRREIRRFGERGEETRDRAVSDFRRADQSFEITRSAAQADVSAPHFRAARARAPTSRSRQAHADATPAP